jgi:hypothetical protein
MPEKKSDAILKEISLGHVSDPVDLYKLLYVDCSLYARGCYVT